MSLTIYQRKALEVAGDEAVRAKLQTVESFPSIVIQFPGAHITRHDAETWLAERQVASQPAKSSRLDLRRWVAVAGRRWWGPH